MGNTQNKNLSLKNKSIINVIQEMVQNNESNEKIIKSLSELGVEKSQAERLLLIAQADTFTLLKSEIKKMIDEYEKEINKKIEETTKIIATKSINQEKKTVRIDLEKDFMKFKVDLTNSQNNLKKSLEDSVAKMAKLYEKQNESLKVSNKRITAVEQDLEETKLKGIKARLSIARISVTLFGIILFIISLFMIWAGLQGETNIDLLTGSVITCIMGVTLIYFSVNL